MTFYALSLALTFINKYKNKFLANKSLKICVLCFHARYGIQIILLISLKVFLYQLKADQAKQHLNDVGVFRQREKRGTNLGTRLVDNYTILFI